MKDIGLKLFALVIAFTLYAIATSQARNSSVTVTVPVSISNLPKTKIVLLPTVLESKVKLQGPSALVNSVISNLAFNYTLPDQLGNQHSVQLRPEDLSLPATITIVSIQPAVLELVLDDLITKPNVPVVVPRIGRLSEHLRFNTLKLEPPVVEVYGPRTEVDTISIVETTPVDLRDVSASLVVEQLIRPPGSYSKPSVDTVQVTVEVSDMTSERIFNAVDVEVRSTGSAQFRIVPSEVLVEVSGPRKLVRRVKASEIVPYVQVTSDSIISGTAPVKVDLPDGIKLVQVEPLEVTLERAGEPASTEDSLVEGGAERSEEQEASAVGSGESTREPTASERQVPQLVAR